MAMEVIFYSVLGYFLGSLMFGYLIPRIFKGIDVRSLSSDGNPGTANAFFYGSAACGRAVLVCDLLKGFLPVHLAYQAMGGMREGLGFALIMAAPVLGHAFPFLGGRKKGGKGIAVTFGVLLGLYPMLTGLWILVFWYLLFTVVIVLEPHGYRTMITYLCWIISGLVFHLSPAVVAGSILISCIVLDKHMAELKDRGARQIRFGLRRN